MSQAAVSLVDFFAQVGQRLAKALLLCVFLVVCGQVYAESDAVSGFGKGSALKEREEADRLIRQIAKDIGKSAAEVAGIIHAAEFQPRWLN